MLTYEQDINKKGMVILLDFERKTHRFISKYSLLQQGDYILVAVSGGPDSLALLDFLYHQSARYKIRIAAAHVDHMLRGEESKEDLIFVKKYCEERNIVFRSASINIKEKMAAEKTGLQETARKYRYQFFEKVLEELHANKLAVGQHGDDQIETILMRLVRGSTGTARAGIQVKRAFGQDKEMIRPLLGVSKIEIEVYCKTHHLNPRRDASNETKKYTRNRFRIDVLPLIKKENGRIIEHFQRFSDELSEDETYLQELAQEAFTKMCQWNGKDELILDIPSFSTIALPLQRRVIHLILNYLYNQYITDLASIHLEALQHLIKGENPSGRLDFPNSLKVIRSYDQCRFTFVEQESSPSYYYEVFADDEIVLPNGKTIQVKMASDFPIQESADTLILQPEDIQFPLIIRTRQQGDKIKVKGMNGTKKIKDIFIDMKIPVDERAIWPIVTDRTGILLWIPGLKKSSYETPPVQQRPYFLIYYSN
ncbi:tRNA lysidine(34) synthetase TilS [Lederbergia panacisoli]|uniref:tRNA lysidine(34) synthetase TilS n=1 Tax=Lederbergia panacisoli TaxID=1255251 RepID=UPI00214C81A7|nr:tRNA lysidine(34) synthetase TilS [Lederbergia panacisoli]MCR2823395.1 tRNA lysidine(34) synthetase TilS [Lederbergia panacisoli]